MDDWDRIERNPGVMGGLACLKGRRVTVSLVVGLIAAGSSREEILDAYPYIDAEDIRQSLEYVAWLLSEAREAPPTPSPAP